MADSYNPYKDLITSMSESINKVRRDYDIVQASEREYERQMNNNKTNVIVNAIESTYGKGLSSISKLSADSIKKAVENNFTESPTIGSFPNAGSILPSRAIGPLEEIPVGTLFSGTRMLAHIVKTTMIRKEHVLRARLAMNSTYKEDSLLGFGPGRAIKNEYTKENQFKPEEFSPSEFTFKIQNIAYGNSFSGFDKYGNKIKNNEKRFPAYITNYSESLSADWDAIQFINAVENSYIYQRTDRSFTLEFILFVNKEKYDFSTNDTPPVKDQIEIFWNTKDDGNREIPRLEHYEIITSIEFYNYLDFLNKIVRPSLNSDGVIVNPPKCKLTIGNHVVDQDCIFEGVTLNYDPLIWDLNEKSSGYLKPMFVGATLTGKYLHNLPSTSTDYYGDLHGY